MKLFHLLDQELCEVPAGVFAPYYYRWLGYRKAPAAEPAVVRALGICALFTESTPVIRRHERIAGNKLSLYSTESALVLDWAKKVAENYGCRYFHTNADHYAPDYSHILTVGLPGLIGEIDASMAVHGDDAAKCVTLQSMKDTLLAFREMILHYADAADACIGLDGYDDSRLAFLAANCRAVTNRKPETFAEALQLVWLCHTAFIMEGRGAMALGRLDQYLCPFYLADLEKGVPEEEIIDLLENVFIRLQDDIYNICVGGQNAKGECLVNGLTRCILKAVGNCNVPGPNLSLRLTENTPDDFLDDCLRTIGTGLGYPALMNDDVNIAALKRYGYEEEDIYGYSMVGCIENFITGMQPPWSDDRFDTPRFFDYIFNRGISQTNGSVGLDTGDPEALDTMEKFMAAYETQLKQGVEEYCAGFSNKNASINQKWFPEPFLSCFCHDCIGRGLDMHNGGAKYPSVHGAALMGIGTVADSLAAIEKVVYLDKDATLSQLRDAMNANFEGYEQLRQKLLAAPKYGNNNAFADKYAVWFLDFLASRFALHRTFDGGGFYIAAAANTSNIWAGKVINATPDGRKRGEPLSDAASPTYGRDTSGTTAAMLSLSRPDYTQVACGSVVNQKYFPSMFEGENLKKLRALIRAYFKMGGQELQINATSREVLLDAMEHPENYKSLVVRVSGFSAYYTTLENAVQLDILNRTQKGE